MRWLAVVLVACSAPARPVVTTDVRALGTQQLLAAVGDAGKLGDLLGAPLVLGGIWFPDPTCRMKFAGAGEIAATAREQFARCLATLRLARSDRTSGFADVAVVTYEPGIELEIEFALQDPNAPSPLDRKTEIRWIGYVARAGRTDALPTVTQHALVAHRTAGSSDAPGSTWLKLCVDATGAVAVHPRGTTSPDAQAAASQAVLQWTFTPFVLAGQPSPVCALVELGQPTGTVPVPLPDAGALVMARKRLGDEAAPVPDEDARAWLVDQRLASAESWLMVCAKPDGTVDRVLSIRPSRVPRWDATLADIAGHWHFEPAPVRTCAAVRVTYSRDGRVAVH